MLKKIVSGFCAGILIAIGGSVFLSTGRSSLGAILFSVALLCICYKGYSLFTGKVGFIPQNPTKVAFSELLLGLLGNFAATTIFGLLLRFTIIKIESEALIACNAKMTQTFAQCFVRAIMCGILMYLAVSIYREKKSISGILFCIPVFILSGFEHSVANMFYFAASGIVSFKAFVYILVCILGNSLGGMLLPLLSFDLKGEKTNG